MLQYCLSAKRGNISNIWLMCLSSPSLHPIQLKKSRWTFEGKATLFHFLVRIPSCAQSIQSQRYHFTQFFIVLRGSLWKFYSNKLQMGSWNRASLDPSHALTAFRVFFSLQHLAHSKTYKIFLWQAYYIGLREAQRIKKSKQLTALCGKPKGHVHILSVSRFQILFGFKTLWRFLPLSVLFLKQTCAVSWHYVIWTSFYDKSWRDEALTHLLLRVLSHTAVSCLWVCCWQERGSMKLNVLGTCTGCEWSLFFSK